MKNSIKQAFLLLLALNLAIILAGGSFIDNTLSKENTGFHHECSDVSKHFEYFHSFCFEDDVNLNHTKIMTEDIQGWTEPLPVLTASFKNTYITCIWQPPKHS
jgi:hypothetical protein